MDTRSLRAAALAAVLVSVSVHAQAPPGYYSGVDATNATTLRQTLHATIEDHTRFPYTDFGTDTWDILELADEDPNDPGRVLDVYKNESFAKQGGGNSFYNREHTWPKSYGFPDDDGQNYPYTDCHQLFLCDSGYNTSRSNKPYRNCDAGCGENPTDANAGQGGGSGVYPGWSNWTEGSFTQGTWETWLGRRGDVARALMYLDVRYEGGNHGVTGWAEPDLILTDSEFLIDQSNTGQNESTGYMGMLSVLVQWHHEDPPDAREVERNDAVFAFQGNRNPFVDHPEWVDCLFGSMCSGDITAPEQVAGLLATPGDALVDLVWTANTEPDLDGYLVHRATTSGGPYTQLTPTPQASNAYTDLGVANGTTYFYVVTAVDQTGNESVESAEVDATPQVGGVIPTADPWINELHYENDGPDVGEFVEVAGPAGLDLSGWQLVGYRDVGTIYDTIVLSGVIPDQEGGRGCLSFDFPAMQNGPADGVALVDDGGQVIELLSYEGTLVATAGAAAGMTSEQIPVNESPATPAGEALQRTDTSHEAAGFGWTSGAETRDAPNLGQHLAVGPPLAQSYGSAVTGSAGTPVLVALSEPLPGTTVTLLADGHAPGTTVLCVLSLVDFVPPLDLSNGILLNVGFPLIATFPLATDANGEATLPILVPLGLTNFDLYFQGFGFDGTGGNTFSASRGLQAHIP